MALRMKTTKVELSKELELTVMRQESIMNSYLQTIDDLQISCAGLTEELKAVDNPRLQTFGEVLFQSVLKLKDFEENYMKTNSLLHALCLSNKKRGDTLLDMVQKLRTYENKIETLEEQLTAHVRKIIDQLVEKRLARLGTQKERSLDRHKTFNDLDDRSADGRASERRADLDSDGEEQTSKASRKRQ